MMRGKRTEDCGILLPDEQDMCNLGKENFKYLGGLEANKTKVTK